MGKSWYIFKKSGSFELLLLCTTRFWHWKLNLVKIYPFYEAFTFAASYRHRGCNKPENYSIHDQEMPGWAGGEGESKQD